MLRSELNEEKCECGCQRATWGIFGDESALCLDCISVNIVTVMLYYSSERCCHWGKLVIGTWIVPCIIFHRFMWISSVSPKNAKNKEKKCRERKGGHAFLSACMIFVQSLTCVRLFATPWTAPCRVSLSFTISWSLLRFISIELVMISNHLILCGSDSVSNNL